MSVEELEKLRKEIVALQKKILLISIPACIAGAILLPFFFGMAFIIPIFLVILIPMKKRNEFTKAYKQTFVKTSLEKVYTDLEYEPDLGISRDVIADTGMMNMGDRYYSDDYVKGKYKNITVEQADVHIEEESTDSDGDTTYYTIFRGKWMIFEFNKNFKADIQVREKGFTNAKVGWLFAKKEDKFKKVQMEDQAFNKSFTVYAQNEHEAFYILTPQLMDKIMTLNEKVNGALLLCFVDNKLHVGLHNNKDDFEPKLSKEIKEDEVINSVVEQIKEVTDFVDELNLSNDLFKINTDSIVEEDNKSNK